MEFDKGNAVVDLTAMKESPFGKMKGSFSVNNLGSANLHQGLKLEQIT
jgi:hypothetical protein